MLATDHHIQMEAIPDPASRLLITVCVVMVAGCGKEVTPTQTKPIASTNTVLQSRLDQIAALPHEHDPAKRPLIVSQRALNNRQWAVQALQHGYHDTAQTNVAWDEQVGRAFEAFVDYSRVSTTNWPVLKKALAAVPSSCSDPMIQYLRVRYHEEPQLGEKTASEFLRVLEPMLSSQYHPVFKFFAGLRTVQAARAADQATDRSRPIGWTFAALEDLARDTNAPVDEVFDAASSWLNHSHSKKWIQYLTSNLDGILEPNWGTTERWFRFRGDAEIWLAWGERGGGWASSVKEKAWDGFTEHLDKAGELLTKAWQMNSNHANTAYLMMQLELGQGQGRLRMETWYDRAMTLDPNYFDAAKLMSFYLEPRWYGSEAATLKFARLCVTSTNWGGEVPLVLVNVHHSLANYQQMSNAPAYWQRPQVWSDVKASYEKFFTLNPEATGWRHDYAKDAYDCGQFDAFLQQTKLFGGRTNYAFFGGRVKFQQMLVKAAAVRP